MSASRSLLLPQVRAPEFRFSADIPRHWNGGDPAKSHFSNAMSIVLPTFERVFITAIAAELQRISDPKLREEARLFCRQEGQHASVHRSYNRWLVSLGYPAVDRFERALSTVMGKLQRLLPRAWMLGLVAGGEHITSYMAHDFLAFPERWSNEANPTLAALWRWHAAEEIEHKAVCFDVCAASGGGIWVRRSGFLLAVLLLAVFGGLGQVYLFWKDGLLFSWRTWARNYDVFFGERGVARAMVREGARYFRKSFHPWDLGDADLVIEWAKSAQERIVTV